MTPLAPDELEQAIVEPARLAGLYLEQGLVDAILEEAGSEAGSLPLMSHALVETWVRRRGNTLTLDDGSLISVYSYYHVDEDIAELLKSDKFKEKNVYNYYRNRALGYNPTWVTGCSEHQPAMAALTWMTSTFSK